MNSDTGAPPKERIQTFPDFEDQRRWIKEAEAVREWLMTLDWPDYVGIVNVSMHGIVTVYPDNPKSGMPEHFQADMLKLLPIRRGKLKRVFVPDEKKFIWNGYLDFTKAPKSAGLSPEDSVVIWFEGITNTKCKMVPKKKEITVWEADCSGAESGEAKE